MNSKQVSSPAVSSASPSACKTPLRGALLIGAASDAELVERLRAIMNDAQSGRAPAPAAPAEADLRAPQRLAIDYADAAELGRQVRQSPQSARRQSARNMEGSARARHLPRPRPRPESRVPLHGPGIAVREHAAAALHLGADRHRDLCRSRSRDDSAARQASNRFCFRGPDRSRRRRQGRRRSAPDRHHAACRAGDRPRTHASPGRLRYPARHDDGPQPRRVRSVSRLRRAAFRRRIGSRQCPRPRHDPRRRRRQGQDGRRFRASRRSRKNPEDHRRLCRDRQHQ